MSRTALSCLRHLTLKRATVFCYILIYIIVSYHTFLGSLTLRKHVTIFYSCNSLAHSFPRSSFPFLLIRLSRIHRKPFLCFFILSH